MEIRNCLIITDDDSFIGMTTDEANSGVHMSGCTIINKDKLAPGILAKWNAYVTVKNFLFRSQE